MHLVVTLAAPVTPETLVSAWHPDPLVLVGVAGAALVYTRGVRRLWQSAGAGQVVSPRRVAAFGGGLAIVVVALVSPLEPLAETLFSAHMVQHLLLALVGPPLVLLGRPLLVVTRGLGDRQRRRIGRWHGRLRRVTAKAPILPVIVVAVYVVVLWVWHVPAVYDATLTHPLVHRLEHVTLLVAAAGFWWPIVEPRRTPAWTAPLMLLVAAIAGGLLSVLLTFADAAWYAAHQSAVAQWGLTALEDQQLAGAIMWVPGGVIYLLAASIAFVRWLEADERAIRRVQAARAARHGRQPQEAEHGT